MSPTGDRVHFDRTLSFNKHVEEVRLQATGKLRVLRAISNTKWGCLKSDLMKIYVGQVRSKMDYSASGWQPMLSNTSMDELERIQNKGLRIVTGNVQSARLTAIRCEANTPAYRTISERNTLRAMEKANR